MFFDTARSPALVLLYAVGLLYVASRLGLCNDEDADLIRVCLNFDVLNSFALSLMHTW